jgi:hypothetical protein
MPVCSVALLVVIIMVHSEDLDNGRRIIKWISKNLSGRA